MSERLRELHGQIAAAYEELFAGSLEEHVTSLAYHYYRSEDQAKALAYLERAIARALEQGATGEAGELLARAAKVAERHGDEAAKERIRARSAGPSASPS